MVCAVDFQVHTFIILESLSQYNVIDGIDNMKIAVVGGGIIGLTTAYELACSGAELVLLEKGKIGGGASGAAGGILSPLQPWQCTSATISLLALSQQRWPRLFDDLSRVSQSFAPISSGILYLDPNDIVAAQRWVQEQGGVGHKLDKISLATECIGYICDPRFFAFNSTAGSQHGTDARTKEFVAV